LGVVFSRGEFAGECPAEDIGMATTITLGRRPQSPFADADIAPGLAEAGQKAGRLEV
jgi:hypothetical protein